MAITTYELTGYANGAAVKSALDKAGTALQAGTAATNVAVTATPTLSSTNVQAAITELDAKVVASAIPYITALSMGAL